MTPKRNLDLPPELWRETLQYLSRNEIIPCSAVSRTFHDLAIPLIFANVHIVLGDESIPDGVRAGESAHHGQPETLPEDEDGERAWFILDRVITDPRFASAVRRLHISAWSHQPLTFERRYLIRALSRLTHLQEIAWTRSPLPLDVADAIVQYQPNLSNLYLSAAGEEALRRFTTLTRLKKFTYSYSHHDPDEEDVLAPSTSVVSAILESCSPTLRALTLPAHVLWTMPVRLLADLTYLDLFEVFDATGLALLFHHLPQLQSLVIAGIHNLDVFPILEAHSAQPASSDASNSNSEFAVTQAAPHPEQPHEPEDAPRRDLTLPHLHSFKLLSHIPVLPSHIATVCAFIHARPLLRRLDLELEWPCSSSHILWETLHSLPALKVLGLCVGQWIDFLPLVGRLPSQLTDLRLSGSFAPHASVDVNMMGLWEALPRLSALRTFYIHSPDLSRGPLNAEEIAMDLRLLEVIAVDRWVYDVERVWLSLPSPPRAAAAQITAHTVDAGRPSATEAEGPTELDQNGPDPEPCDGREGNGDGTVKPLPLDDGSGYEWFRIDLREWSSRRTMTHSVDDWGSVDAEWLVRYMSYSPK